MAKSKEYELAIKIAGEVERSFKSSMNLTQKELRQIARQAAQTNSGIQNSLSTGLKAVEGGLTSFEGAAKQAFSVAAKAAAVAGTAITGIAAASINVGSSYEAQMSTVQSISGATGSEMDLLKAKAKEMGESTVFSATEAGQAMEYMAMAGWKTEDMLNGIDGIMDLAAASGEDLGTTSDIVTDALTAFGLTAADSTRLADVMAAASSNANTNVSMMGETFSYVAPIAGALGYSIEDTSLAIGLMANSGIKASAAGTALRKIFSNTAQGIELSSKAMGEFKIKTSKADGSMRELSDVLPELRTAFSKMTEKEKAANAEAIAGKTAMSGLLAIVNASESDYNKLSKAIENSAGAAERMADIKIDNLKGDITLLKSAAEGLGIELYDQMNAGLRGGTTAVTSIIGDITDSLKVNDFIAEFSGNIQKNTPTIIRNVKQAGEAIADFAEPVIDVGTWMFEHPQVIESALVGIGTAIISLKLAVNIGKVAAGFASLAGILTNPFALAITAVGVAIGGAAGITTYIKKANEEMAKQSLAKHFGNIALSIDELSEAAEYIIDNGNISKLNEAMSAFGELDGISSEIDQTLAELNKMNWKVSIGMELSHDDQQTYQQDITDFIEDSKQAIEQKQYAMSMNLQIFTDDDETGNEIRNRFTEFYQSNYETVSDLGTKLQDAVNEAFSDGLLTIDESQKIQELQNQIADITEQIAGSEFDAKMDVLGMKFSSGDLDPESFKNLQEEIQSEVDASISQYDEALQMNIASAKVMLDQGAIDSTEYDNMVSEFKENYLEQVGQVELKAQDFSINTIVGQYGDELEAAIPDFQEKFQSVMAGMMEGRDVDWETGSVQMWQGLLQELGNVDSLDSTTKESISQLLEQMQPTAEDLQKLANKYNELGYQVPSAISKGITAAATLGAMADGNESSIWTLMGDAINNNEDYTALVNSLRESGGYIPPEIVNGMESNKGVLATEVQNLHDFMQAEVTAKFQNEFNVPVKINVQTQVSQTGQTAGTATPTGSGIPGESVPAYASGGLIKEPTLATFAEEGPEMAIPLNGSERSISLWQQAGEMLGVNKQSSADKALESLNGTSSQEVGNVTYSPQIIIQGNADKSDIDAANNEAYEKFELLMEKYMRNQSRFSFS